MDLIDLFKKEYNKNAIDIGVTGTELAKQRKNFQPMAEENEKKKKIKPQDFLKDKNDLKDILMLVKNKKLSANKLKSIVRYQTEEDIKLFKKQDLMFKNLFSPHGWYRKMQRKRDRKN